jgi:hypothetical protein
MIVGKGKKSLSKRKSGAQSHKLVGTVTPRGGALPYHSYMDGYGIDRIVRELSDLLDQPMQIISGRGFQDLTDEELANYQPRNTRIAALRSQLVKFARPI